ncbi:MAG: hypothetical protein JXR75_02420, partial [Rhodobacteraceae bacterium]|nr:hypothetical protein [Paracoccaceae bacterium]
MYITYVGPQSPLDSAFLNTFTGDADLQVISLTPTLLVVRNPSTGVVTSFTGVGLPTTEAELDSPNPPGTVTGCRSADAADQTIMTVQNINWGAAQLLFAIQQLIEADNDAPLIALASLQPVTLDATNAPGGTRDLTFAGVTSAVTVFSSSGPDELEGGSGNDTMTIVDNSGDGDTIYASPGNDRYVFGPSSNDASWIDLVYSEVFGPISVTINGPANTGTIVKGGQGTDTLVNVNNLLDDNAQSLNIWGSRGNDSFTINGGSDTWTRIVGGEGQDTYNLTLTGTIRLTLAYSWTDDPSAGNVVNLATGQILNDGFGNAEALNLTAGAGRLELETSDRNDNIIGSAARESFILRGGNDTLDGGGGFDRLRFDRGDSNSTSAVTVDLAVGTVTGTWRNVAFTKTISNIEEIRGTNFSDVIRGSAAAEFLEGRGGNDLLDGRDGEDELIGDAGNDRLIGGTGNDYLEGGDGNDTLDGSADTTGFGDYIRPGRGANTIIGSQTLFQVDGDGIDLAYTDVSGVGGLTILIGANGTGTTRSGTVGLVDDSFSWAHYFDGSQDSDLIRGFDEATGDANAYRFEGFVGHAGNDTIHGGTGGFDVIDYRSEARENPGARGVVVNFATSNATDTYGDADRLFDIESVRGTGLADVFTGAAGAEYLRYRGYAGADTIIGSVATLSGDGRSIGWDDIDYSRDIDDGGAAGIRADLITGLVTDGFGDVDTVSNIDGVRGTNAADVIIGSNGSNRLRGFDGSDTLDGGLGDDFLFGGATEADLRDVIYGGGGNDSIDGGWGNDSLLG